MPNNEPRRIANATQVMANGWAIEFVGPTTPVKSCGGFMIYPHPETGELLMVKLDEETFHAGQ